jgi:hypothetical protein
MSSDLTNFIDIDHLWLESVGFEVEHDGDLVDGAWRMSYTATSPMTDDGVYLCYSSPVPSTWELCRTVKKPGTGNGIHVSIPLDLSDDGNDVLKLAELLGIKLKA